MTDGRSSTINVKTPNSVPNGNETQFTPAITRLKTRRRRLAIARPDRIVRIPDDHPKKTASDPMSTNIYPIVVGGGPGGVVGNGIAPLMIITPMTVWIMKMEEKRSVSPPQTLPGEGTGDGSLLTTAATRGLW